MTVAETARKQGHKVLNFILGCVTAVARGKVPPSLLAGVPP